MTQHDLEAPTGDPFGSTRGERLWRRLAGAGVAVMAAAAGFTAWTPEVLPWVLLGAVVVYALGVPVSWWIARGSGAPILRHVLAAVALGVLVGGVLSLPGDPATWPVLAVFAVGIGIPVAAMAAWAGIALPRRAVRPAAIAGLVVAALVLPLGTWLQARPPAPYDFVVVEEPEFVRHHFADAPALAEAIAVRFERRDGHERTAHATWVAVGRELSDGELRNVASWIRFTLDEDLPTHGGTDEPVRLVTTIFEGEALRGCVVVTADAARAEPQACADLGIAD